MTTIPVAPDGTPLHDVPQEDVDEAVSSVADHPVYAHLSPGDVEAIGAELDDLRARTFAQRGEADRRYILRVLRLQQAFELTGRLAMFGVVFSWWALLPGIVLLSLSKILDNMELGHNILRWMRQTHSGLIQISHNSYNKNRQVISTIHPTCLIT